MAKSFPNTGATVGLAADRTALTSPFAGMQFFETDTKALYLYDGSAWVSMLDTDTPPAFQLIKPTSVSGTNVTLSGYKTTISNGGPAIINGVFSSNFSMYKVLLFRAGATTYPYLAFQLCSGGTPNTASYNAGRIIGETTVAYYNVSTTYAPFMASPNSLTALPTSAELTLDGPFLAANTGYFSSGVANLKQLEFYAGIHQVATSFDGIKILTSDSTAFTGSIVVYGLTGS